MFRAELLFLHVRTFKQIMPFSFTDTTILVAPTTHTQSIHLLAHATWQPTYQHILSQAQIDYMLETMYSQQALQKQMDEGHVFLLATKENVPVAFASYSLSQPQDNIFKLNKLYIHPQYQGFGIGKLLLQEVVDRTQALGGTALELNVHRKNPAQHFYLKHGFSIYQILDIPFGSFMLNDYIMRLPLPPIA
jgi:diamine N-acetyltransferase